MSHPRDKPLVGRGADFNPPARYVDRARVAESDGWDLGEDPIRALQTTVLPERAKSMLTYNDSPDIGFDRSLNPFVDATAYRDTSLRRRSRRSRQ